MSDALPQAIVKLFETERFYAELVASMRRISTESTYLAAVNVTDHINLYINHKNFDVLPVETRAAILKHECEHILRDHIARAKEIDPTIYDKREKSTEENIINNMKHKTLNIAMDMAINGGIRHLPEGGIKAENFDLPDGLTTEAYLEALKNNEKAKDFMDFDDHSLWGESEGDKDVLKERVRQAVNDAAKRTRQAGKLTGEQEMLVSKLNASRVNWRDVLKRFVGRQIDFNTDTSRKKRNRRYGIMYPGMVRAEENLHIGVAIDTSGSVPDEALIQFMAEIAKIAKYAKVTVVEADSEIKNVYEFKPKQTYKLTGRGGTAYQPAFDYYNVNPVDAVVYFGDMDSADEITETPKYPVLWAIYGNQEPPGKFGSKVKVVIS